MLSGHNRCYGLNERKEFSTPMWNNKRTEELEPKVAQPRPVVTPVVATPQPIVAKPAEQDESKLRGHVGKIGTSMTVKGEIYSREELYVDGEIQGSIELRHKLTVGPNGKIHANVKAKEVVIEGSLQGDVQSAEKIIVREKGNLVGDIKTAGIVIEDGAYFKGNIDITRTEVVPKAPAS